MEQILENPCLRITVDPAYGGRVTSFFAKKTAREFLWFDRTRLPADPALDYDGNFAGGMDELLPCDLPENGWPDHGELWTLPLDVEEATGEKLTLAGSLPKSEIYYRRTMSLQENSLVSEYTLRNIGKEPVSFLWKMHAALRISRGDRFFAPAQCVQAADPGNWSRSANGMPERWCGDYIIPEMDGSSDFFYLTALEEGSIRLVRTDGGVFRCDFDLKQFSAVWIFASFRRLNGSQTLVMEPCTNYPILISDAKKAKICAQLGPQKEFHTRVIWTAE